MKLDKISFDNGKWRYKDLELEEINLIVGKNAKGKTRTLNSIKDIMEYIAGKSKKNLNGSYELEFSSQEALYRYKLEIKLGEILKEELEYNGEIYLIREKNGVGKIYSEHEKKNLEFSIDNNLPAIFYKRDKLHHKQLEEINKWCQSSMYCEFGSKLGRTTGTTDKSIEEVDDFYFTESEYVVRNLRIAFSKKKYGKELKQKLLEQMGELGYIINDIKFVKYQSATNGGDIYGLVLLEDGVEGGVRQLDISQGMFRAFSILVHTLINFYEKKLNLLIIDDIGEGLDYDRATKLIKIIMENSQNSGTQLLMATNDRHIMNNIPLKYWYIINSLKDNSIKFYSYKNSKERFDEFDYTGLSNFDFFITSFYLEQE